MSNLFIKQTHIRSKIQPQTIVTVSLAIVTLFMHLRLYEYSFDDAFIHFRVARNLLDSGVPYYNVGEAVKVSTSTAWIIFLVPVIWLTRLFQIPNALPLVVGLLNALLTVSGALTYTAIVHTLAGKEKIHFLLAATFQIIYISFMLIASIGLMETPLALLLAGLGFHRLQLDRRSGYTLLGIAAYIRIEIGILILVAGLYILLRKTHFIPQAMLFTIAGILPFLLFDLYFFGSPIPHSIIAKSIIYDMSAVWAFMMTIFLSFPSGILFDIRTVFAINLIALAGTFFFALIFGIEQWRQKEKPYFFMLMLWSALCLLLYTAGQTFIFGWYVPLYMIPLTTAVSLMVVTASRLYHKLVCALFLFYLSISCVFSGYVLYAAFDHPGQFDRFEEGARVRTYKHIGRVLNSEYPQATLLSSEIGGLGYEFTGKILDAAGLASPEALKYHPMKVPEEREHGALGAIPPGYVEETLPEIIVTYDSFATALMNSNIIQQYNEITIDALLPQDRKYSSTGLIWGNKYLRVYIRKDLPVSQKILDLASKTETH